MKILAIADLHLNHNNRFSDFIETLRQIAKYAIKNKVKALLIAGDVYQRRRPSSIERNKFELFISSLIKKSIEIHIIPGLRGRHDLEEGISTVDEFKALEVKGVTVWPNPIVIPFGNYRIFLGHCMIKEAKLGPLAYSLNEGIPIKELIKQYPADIYCFDNKTEALTKEGWKKYNKIKKTDKIATLNLINHQIEYQNYSKKYVLNFNGDIIELKSKLSFCGTPDHRILYKNQKCRRPGKNYKNNLQIKSADYVRKLKGQLYFPVSGQNKQKDFAISDNWIRLTAWIIAEGHFRLNQNAINITQQKSKAPQIRKILTKLKLKFGEYKRQIRGYTNNFGITSKKDVSYFYIWSESTTLVKQYVKEKNIPNWIKQLSQRQFKIFLETLVEGDGHKISKTAGHYYTSNKSLADKLQQLLIENGFKAMISKRIHGLGNRLTYCVQYCEKLFHCVAPNSFVKKNYKGKVWCVTVPNSTIVIRRKGRAMITGNCLGHIHTPQLISEVPPAFYCGSIDRVDFGERNEIKGMTLIDTNKEGKKYSFIPLKIRPMKQIEITDDWLKDKSSFAVKDTIVKVIVHTTKDKAKQYKEPQIRHALISAYKVKSIIFDIKSEAIVRDRTINESLSPLKAFQEYAKKKRLASTIVSLGEAIIKKGVKDD